MAIEDHTYSQPVISPMAKVAGRGKSVIGLFVDGLDVKLAHLVARKNRIIVQELRSATLITKLQEQKPAEPMAPAVGDSKLGAAGAAAEVRARRRRRRPRSAACP